MWLDGHKSQAARLSVPIIGFIGANGSGKSLLAVADSLVSLRAGRPVLSSARLVDPDETEPCDDDSCTFSLHPNHRKAHPLWRQFRSWQDVLDAKNCDILMDEVSGIASSRESRALPTEVGDKLHQLRRDDVVLRWTAPSYARSEIMIREVTQAVVLCRGLFRKRVEGNRSWKASTLIASNMVDAKDLDELTQSQRLGTAREPLTSYGRGLQLVSRTEGRLAYATMDSVSSIASAWSGTCLGCGGRKTQPRCDCDAPARKGGSPAPVAAVADGMSSAPAARRRSVA